MADPILFGQKAVAQISATVKQVGATVRNPEPAPRGRWQKSGSKRAVILDESLPAAVDSMTAPSSAMATILEWDGSAYSRTDEQIEVFNHSESTSYGSLTFGFAEMIDGHDCFGGDCAPMRDAS